MPKIPEIGSATYRQAAIENLGAAQAMHREGCYGVAHYSAGRAVECMLRALRWRFDTSFEARHDLEKLLKQSKYWNLVPEGRTQEVAAEVGLIIARWRNDFRFRSEQQVIECLMVTKVAKGKNDRGALKESSRAVVAAATTLVTLANERWERWSRN